MPVTRETLRLAKQLRIDVNGTVDVAVRELVEAWARAWEQIDGSWQAAVDDLVRLSKDGRWPSPAQIARADRAQKALQIATREILGLSEFTGVTVTTAAREVTDQVAFWQARLIASQMPREPGTVSADLVARFSLVDANAIGAIVERSVDQINARTRPLSKAATEAMKQALVRGVAVGENPRAAARRMMRLAEGQFNGGLSRALVIARTEILDAHRSGTAAAQFANADILQGWMWDAQLDKRTCPSCWAKHGTVYDLAIPGPNDHQQGRCARTPVVKSWKDLGFDITEPPSLISDAQQAFSRMPKTDQLQVLGPVRLKALDTGAMSWSQLSVRRTTNGWRDSYVPVSIDKARRALVKASR